MKLVEAEAEGPIEGEDAVVTPPRPPHRRVSVSVLFTLTILIGTVVAIYVVFPARDNLLLTEAMEHHTAKDVAWDLTAPTSEELRIWAIGVVGKGAPPPPENAKIIGAGTVNILDRRAAIVRVAIDNQEVTYLVQRARGVAPKRADRTEDDLRAVAWRVGKFTCVAVGPAATAASWEPLFAAKK